MTTGSFKTCKGGKDPGLEEAESSTSYYRAIRNLWHLRTVSARQKTVDIRGRPEFAFIHCLAQ